MWKDRGRKFFFVGGEFPAPFFAFFLFLPRNGHFCAHVCQKRHGDIAHKPVCVRGKRRGRVSEQEKVVSIKSYEGLSVFLELVACLDGFTSG